MILVRNIENVKRAKPAEAFLIRSIKQPLALALALALTSLYETLIRAICRLWRLLKLLL